ncbi:hypothetical protein L195_g063529, partial [Trifolium pratense]
GRLEGMRRSCPCVTCLAPVNWVFEVISQPTDIGAPFLSGMSLIKLAFGDANLTDPFLKCFGRTNEIFRCP